MSNKIVVTSFLGAVAVITYRDFKNPGSDWPLGSVPPPSRYAWAGVAFGICALIADMVNVKIGAVIAAGLFVGLLFNVVTGKPLASAGLTTPTPAPLSKNPTDHSQTAGGSF